MSFGLRVLLRSEWLEARGSELIAYICGMHYVSVEGLSKSYGIKPLFSGISFHIEEGDKIALVAKNGTGKSTLLKILSGKETAEGGKVWVHKDVTIALFEQDPQFMDEKSILDNIPQGGTETGAQVKETLSAHAREVQAAMRSSREAGLKVMHTLTQNYATLVSGVQIGRAHV